MRTTLVVLFCIAAACGCSRAVYPPEYRAAFMSSCQVQGESEAHCTCMLERLEAEVPAAEFEAADRAVQSGQDHPVAARIRAFSEACRAS